MTGFTAYLTVPQRLRVSLLSASSSASSAAQSSSEGRGGAWEQMCATIIKKFIESFSLLSSPRRHSPRARNDFSSPLLSSPLLLWMFVMSRLLFSLFSSDWLIGWPATSISIIGDRSNMFPCHRPVIIQCPPVWSPKSAGIFDRFFKSPINWFVSHCNGTMGRLLPLASNFPRITIGPGVSLSIFVERGSVGKGFALHAGTPFSEHVS